MLPPEDRALTLDDTQGMFLLLAIGFVAGGGILLSEIFGGCFNLCKKSKASRATSTTSSIPSNPRFHERQTNRERHHSIHLGSSDRRQSFHSMQSKEFTFSKFMSKSFQRDELEEAQNLDKSEEDGSNASQVDYSDTINELFDNALSMHNDTVSELEIHSSTSFKDYK